MNAQNVVQELWRLCTILRKDGITYQQYVTELTYLLFLKMMQERGQEAGSIPLGHRWVDLLRTEGLNRLQLYRETLALLGNTEVRINGKDKIVARPTILSAKASKERKTHHKKVAGDYAAASPLPWMVLAIFANSSTFLREPGNLKTLVEAIDKLHWFSEERDQFGDLYEGLLQKNAEETKRGAGQYFTPRALIDVIVKLMKPKPGEIIQDPASGTGGFLIAADRYIRARADDYRELADTKKQEFQRTQAFHGFENVPATYRLLLMNLFLHGLSPAHVELGDTLSPAGARMKPANLILTNPPFGPAGGAPTRDDLVETANVSSYQLPFVEHCIRNLAPEGRAAIIIPDNVLFEGGRGQTLRSKMLRECKVHTILRLPTGIFYAQGVKTNVIFLQKGAKPNRASIKVDETKEVWFYDLRNQMPQFGKTNQLTPGHFQEFIAAYGDDPDGNADRQDEGEGGRFRKFSRRQIADRNDNLDVTWLREENDTPDDGLIELDDIAAAIFGHLQTALEQIQSLQMELAEKELEE
ncbi:N-6 DNA methylase [Mesorhizobium sp. M0633]|uniref:HsdM family class I SAM-dependent methyltransferase n=1 Tax=Mesorhizobium sp. M0633 TaxID=2956977 RepID=UPI00333865C1